MPSPRTDTRSPSSSPMADAGEETDDDMPQPADDDVMTDDDQPAAAPDDDTTPTDSSSPSTPQFNATAAHSFKSPAYLAKKAASSASRFRQAKVILSGEQYHKYPATVPAYPHIRAGSSQYPRRKYCDVTHFAATYTDPRTRLHYVDALAFAVIRSWGRDEVNARLALRRAQPGEIK